MAKRIIKDPTYNIYSKGGNVEKILSGGGPNETPLDMKQFIKMADAEKREFDIQTDLLKTLMEAFQDERKPGQSFNDWLKSKPIDELKRLSLANGGSVEEKYGELIDAYEKGIDVMPGENLTKYIERIRKNQLLEKAKRD